MSCCGDMEVVQVTPDATMMVDGYAHQTLQCAQCGERETRLAFKGVDPDPAPELPPATVEHEPQPALGAWQRAVKKLRDQQHDLTERAMLTRAAEHQVAFSEAWKSSFQPRTPEPARVRPERPATPADLVRRMRVFKAGQQAPTPPREAQRPSLATSKWERAVAKLGGRWLQPAAHARQIRPSAPIDDFDRIWDGQQTADALPAVEIAEVVPAHAEQSRSLVPRIDETFGLWARAIVLLRGAPRGETHSPR